MPEEKKTDETTVSEESDFADEAKPVAAPAPEPVPEEPAPEKGEGKANGVELHDDSAALDENPTGKGQPAQTYTYDDPHLQAIEDARKGFFAIYKKANLIKWIVTGGALVLIVLGWVIPNFALGSGVTDNVKLYITLGVAAVAVLMLGIYSYLYRKKLDVAMKAYFAEYYTQNNAYVFGDQVTDLSGGVEDKLQPEIFQAAGLYKDVAKVGSRACLHFNYKGKSIVFADCAGQAKGQKSLLTVYVGKFWAVPNASNLGDVVIYLKGNKRALPPTTVDTMNVIEDSKTMVIFGPEECRKLLSHDLRQAIAQIRTDAVLVDLAISIKEGMTYIAMGYEDSLMVLPLEKPFNSAPTKELKMNVEQIFRVIDAIDGEHKN